MHWCLNCQSALAEAEVEYQEKESHSIDVAFDVIDRDKMAAAFGIETDKAMRVVIWTTTPWTLPANQGIALGADLSYALVDTTQGALIIAEEKVSTLLERYALCLLYTSDAADD